MKENFEVKILTEDSIDEQVNVFKIAFKSPDMLEKIKENWIKKHFSNPYGNSYIFGVYDETKLVSINVFMPMKYIFKEKVFTVVQSCESGTLPEYQGKGIWNLIIMTAMEFFKSSTDIDFMMGFPNHTNSYPGFIKRKWSCITNIKNYILCVNGNEFLNSLKKNNHIKIGRIFELQQIKCKLLQNKNYKIEFNLVKNFESDKRDGFNLLKIKSFFQWKMMYKNIETIEIFKDKEYILTLFYGISSYKNSKIILIYDIQYHNFNYREIQKSFSTGIIKLVEKYKDIAFIRGWCTENSLLDKLLKDLFFIQVKHLNPFIIYPLRDEKINNTDLLNSDNWKNITFMDLD